MSGDMIKINTFTDATESRKIPPSDPRTRRGRGRLFNGPGKGDGGPVIIEALHLHH